MGIDAKLAKIRELTTEREKIDAQISSLKNEVQTEFSNALSHKTRKAGLARKCSNCGETGHRATTCPRKQAA